MGEANFIILPIAALIPLILGFIWYHPSVMGTALATATGRSVDQLGTKGSLVKTAFIYLFSLLMAYILMAVTVHQYAIFQLFMFEPSLSEQGSDIHSAISDFMNTYGHRHRSFFHGVLHGAEISLFFGLALLGISTFAEGLPVKRLLIHLSYFVLCGALMGGLICAYI